MKGVSLRELTTFNIGGMAEYFATAKTEDELVEYVTFAKDQSLPLTIIGGGSNIVVADEGVKGLVLKNNIEGLEYREEEEKIFVTAGAGMNFDDLVATTVGKGWWGLENLSAIPGSVGATPIQNIGAYGVEVADTISSVKVFDVTNSTFKELSKDECVFGYRDSIFKTPTGKNLIVVSVTYCLSLTPLPTLHYKDLATHFQDRENTKSITQEEIRNVVMEIRAGKFPDWKVLGTAGSFFKNPIINKEDYERLQSEYPGLPGYPEKDQKIKVSLGWILDHVCNLRGYREGNVGLYEKQALVMVNYKDATAGEVKNFAEKISQTVFEKTKIKIEREVNYVK